MMEGMNQLGQEEYIWSMRTTLYKESDSELWKARRPSHIASKTSKSFADSEDEQQTRVIASLVPDEVLNNVNDYSHRKYEACFLFGDVSGFTELCEKYTKTGLSGPSRLTQVLNKYMGSMVQEIMSHDGDVLKFSGDAFLAMFKKTEDEPMRDVVHEALDSALVIQKTYGSFLTDVGVVIRVKLAISAGHVTFALIGDNKTSHYVVVGKPIWDCKAAEHISVAGDIIVAPAAWHYVNTTEYIYKEMENSVHIKLLGVGPNWRSVQKNIRQNKSEEDNASVGSKLDEADSVSRELVIDQGANEDFALRPAVNNAVRLRIKEQMRKFIIAPVIKSIDMNEPFEYLTEMRQAVIVFINVVSYRLESEDATVILADQSYKIVCRVVDKMKGCVNKVSLFDKDLMFVVVFGLRGLKHELECQVALRCARECFEEINKLNGVLSTSIGVTTGKTYCGVFGHTLRREYTVISLLVNKAARLMCAYKGKVTCDRETFLHSKLEAKHFLLQEYKNLKGISHPGPVYEFKEAEINHEECQKVNAQPIIGRQEKLKLYKTLLDQFLSVDTSEKQYKMLLIKGDARQGKSRLFEEMVYVSPNDIMMNRFTLALRERRIPFQTIRLIFNLPLALTAESSVREKQQKLQKMLKKIQVPDLMCILNKVFGVNFNNSDLYVQMSEQAKHEALKKMLKQLCYAVFLTPWIIAIDNCHFIDDESWSVLDAFFDIKTLFFIGTISRDNLGLLNQSVNVLEDPRIRSTTLGPVEKHFLAALVCQILDVYAISPELENAVQVKSNGNPGWIESYLISLIQDNELFILKASLRDINDMGLVCPPVYLMQRMNPDESRKWQHIMEERQASTDSLAEQDKWRRYIEICRDSYLNVTIRELLENMSESGKLPICIISSSFDASEEETELSMDAVILKTFDSLNFYEQLLVKCSAVLGLQFFREMLLYVMAAHNKRKVALAVKKLFEIKVINCAKGDFIEGGGSFFKDKPNDPNEDDTCACTCKGLRVDESCTDLPRYASCGFMQFRSSSFRDTTYNLLTDNQKKDFHQRAIRYLERDTRKCRACGSRYFERILGDRQDKEFLIFRDRRRQLQASGSVETASISRRASIHSTSTTVSGGSGTKKKMFDEKSIISSPSSMFAEKKESKTATTWFGFSMINKLKDSYSLTRAFSTEDFTDCVCNQILSTTYSQMMDHCNGSDDMNKLIDVMLEYAYVSLQLYNTPLALKILEESLKVISTKLKDSGGSWKFSLMRGKVYNLMGHARAQLGQYNSAFRNLHLGLKEFGVKFPTGLKRDRMIMSLQAKQMFAFYVFPRTLMKHYGHWETIYTNNLAECLAHLCDCYMIKGDWKNALMAANWSLVKALAAFSDFQLMCIAYSNMLRMALFFKKYQLCRALEIHGLKLCHLKRNAVEADDLRCVARLYSAIFKSRYIRTSIERSIHMGYIVLRLCASIRAVDIILPILPLFIQELIMGKHFVNAYSAIEELNYFSKEDTDFSGKVWYLALCMVMQLETGYTVLPYQICHTLYQGDGDYWITIRDPNSRKLFFTVMWLWCLRNEKYAEAGVWCFRNTDFTVITEKDPLVNHLTALYLLEGMILFMGFQSDKRNIRAFVQAESEINTLIIALEGIGRKNKIILPRLHHLKAYFKFVKSGDVVVEKILSKARYYAEKQGNALELSWIEHSTKAWTRTLPSIAIDFWKDHTEQDNLLDFQDIEVGGGRLGHFTLPTPVYL